MREDCEVVRFVTRVLEWRWERDWRNASGVVLWNVMRDPRGEERI